MPYKVFFIQLICILLYLILNKKDGVIDKIILEKHIISPFS